MPISKNNKYAWEFESNQLLTKQEKHMSTFCLHYV